MLKKGNKLFGIINNKCPKCHEGNFYIDKNPFHLSKVLSIHDKCSSCGLKYMLEPSFYHGAMYVSYGLSVATSIITFLLSKVLFGFSLMTSFIIVIVSLIALTPIMLKLSRIIYINMFVSYKNPNEVDKKVDSPKD